MIGVKGDFVITHPTKKGVLQWEISHTRIILLLRNVLKFILGV